MKHLWILLSLLSMAASAQVTITGTVSDQSGNPLAGATVFLESSYSGASTNFNGDYQLQSEKGMVTLVARYIGYGDYRLDLNLKSDTSLNIKLSRSAEEIEAFTVQALRNYSESPMAVDNIDRGELNRNNLGQDLPILLNFSPSIVTTSDAGAGVGYTGLRIRGSDASRVNVTINGIPLNDAESQGVFWVNMPDFASSVGNIQIQRGVGASTNGSGAFGASLNMTTDNPNSEAYAEFNNSFGSFNTRKHTLEFSSGKIRNYWNFQGRLSQIQSDGYIDRASADLQSYYLAAAFAKGNTSLKAIHFSGKERTYQSWYGTPESRINGDVAAMNAHADSEGLSDAQRDNLLNAGRTYNHYLYENEVDDYGQDHYQLHFSQKLGENTRLNLAGHYTFGEGFFEQYREDDALVDYGCQIVTPALSIAPITTDLIRRRWLRNHFAGMTFSLIRDWEKLRLRWGGAYHYYDGEHFGEIVWLENSFGIDHLDRYYTNKAYKNDANSFIKLDYSMNKKTRLYLDLQGRYVAYSALGPDNDQRMIQVDTAMLVFNPKAGVSYRLNNSNRIYFSYAVGNREPTRNDFIDALPGVTPKPEQMHDLELGYERSGSKISYAANAYFMYYRNQLVLTGELNDVGSAIRTNVPESYRAGIELMTTWKPAKFFELSANYTYSQNKISEFTQVLYDYTTGFDIVETKFSNTDISFSPSHVGMLQLRYFPVEMLELALLNKAVGRQFLDNTSDVSKSLDPYFTSDLRLRLLLNTQLIEDIEFSLLVNNIWNTLYSSNGYTYSYIYGEAITQNFFYPQAGANFLVGLNLRF